MNDFNAIKKLYAELLPGWMDDYAKTGNQRHDPYFRDWLAEFTPIESMVWHDIRSSGCSFFPQFPACGYFLDFANPFLKIAIECDGAAFHDASRDKIRDDKLQEAGWLVFRIKGKECNRLLPDPWSREEYPEGADDATIYEWFNTTSTGVMYAIRNVLFTKPEDRSAFCLSHETEVYRTLDDHCSTRGTYMTRVCDAA